MLFHESRGQKFLTDPQVSQRQFVGRRALGLDARGQVQARKLRALGRVVDEFAPFVQMVDDLDQPLPALLRAGMALYQAPDREMDGLLAIGINEGVGRLLHTVVLEPIDRVQALPVRLCQSSPPPAALPTSL